MKNVVIYTTVTCPYCVRAKQLLQSKGLTYTEIRVDLDDTALNKMISLSKRRTVPQIFIDDQHIGGYDDLYAFFTKNI